MGMLNQDKNAKTSKRGITLSSLKKASEFLNLGSSMTSLASTSKGAGESERPTSALSTGSKKSNASSKKTSKRGIPLSSLKRASEILGNKVKGKTSLAKPSVKDEKSKDKGDKKNVKEESISSQEVPAKAAVEEMDKGKDICAPVLEAPSEEV